LIDLFIGKLGIIGHYWELRTITNKLCLPPPPPRNRVSAITFATNRKLN